MDVENWATHGSLVTAVRHCLETTKPAVHAEESRQPCFPLGRY